MITYRCPNCHAEVESEGKLIMVMCGCGYKMYEVRINPKKASNFNRNRVNLKDN
jgi:DNA-directed RNA polymerase subunit RPC12/RpoP